MGSVKAFWFSRREIRGPAPRCEACPFGEYSPEATTSNGVRHLDEFPLEVEALCVVTRRSTEVVAVDDPDVAGALQYIHRQQGRDISVESVVQAVAVSRRNLEKRFRECLGRTILEEIQLTRLERAKRLLLETTYPISKVAEIAGFGSTGYFIQFFQNRVGKTPRKFRIELSS